MIRPLIVALGALLPTLILGADYRFEALPEENLAEVTVTLEKGASGSFWMPAWAPGDYQLFDYGKNLENVRFFRGGAPVQAVQGDNPNLWTIDGGADRVVYRVKPSRGNFTINLRIRPEETFFSGPAVLGWFDGHANERHTLTVVKTPRNAIVECSLRRLESREPNTAQFEAKDYDELIDAPVVIGTTLRVKEFKVRGKDHAFVAFGSAESADLDAFAAVATGFIEQSADLFGELPYDRYLFLADFGGGGGGLEHRNSTRLGLGRNTRAEQAASFIGHEFFHAFNVKRIRSKALGPFDYTKPAVTGALWWLEGVTDYYATILGVRAGQFTKVNAWMEMMRTVRSFDRVAEERNVSADESSRRVWETRGSQGFGISYYSKGKGAGFLLDLAIRAKSDGKHSLDDVIRKLYEETKGGKPGFAETRIRELCIEFGGASLAPIYDACVMTPGPLPLAMVFREIGLEESEGTVTATTEVGRRTVDQWPLAIGR